MALELYDIMAEDMYITANLRIDGQITTVVINDDEEVLFTEISHPAAWESLVYFAKQIVSENEKIERQIERKMGEL